MSGPVPSFPLELFAAFSALLFGLLVGSFANVVIHRLPLEQSIVFPSSRCPHCGASIRPWQNIPVISWILLRGRCAGCDTRISFRYPVVESIHGLGFALIVFRFGLNPFTPFLFLFFFALVVLAFIDWDHQILPDVITLPGILVGVFGAFLPGALIDWKQSALAAAFGYAVFFLVAKGYARIRGVEGLGQGDWKLAAMMGAFLGVQPLLLTVFLGSISGLVYGLVQAIKLRGQALDSPGEVALVEGSQSLEAPTGELEMSAEGGSASAASADSSPAAVFAPEAAQVAPAEAEPEETDQNQSIGKYRLPFGTFLAASAVFVLFLGDPVLAWYASLFRF